MIGTLGSNDSSLLRSKWVNCKTQVAQFVLNRSRNLSSLILCFTENNKVIDISNKFDFRVCLHVPIKRTQVYCSQKGRYRGSLRNAIFIGVPFLLFAPVEINLKSDNLFNQFPYLNVPDFGLNNSKDIVFRDFPEKIYNVRLKDPYIIFSKFFLRSFNSGRYTLKVGGFVSYGVVAAGKVFLKPRLYYLKDSFANDSISNGAN